MRVLEDATGKKWLCHVPTFLSWAISQMVGNPPPQVIKIRPA